MTNKSDNLILTSSFNQWEEEFTFWIEGVCTPVISAAGLIGTVNRACSTKILFSFFVTRDFFQLILIL